MSSQSSWWMDTAECQGVVGQIILNDSMVVRTCRWLTKRLSAKGGGGGRRVHLAIRFSQLAA